MNPARNLLDMIQEAGATIWAEGHRLKFQGLPAGLIPAVRENKVALLALLTSTPAPAFTPLPSDQCSDEYARLERAAIQAEGSWHHPPPACSQRQGNSPSACLVGNASTSNLDPSRLLLADAWRLLMGCHHHHV
ncbi:MAG: hypothetical protein AB7U29_21190 [Desulfobulbus sp.]